MIVICHEWLIHFLHFTNVNCNVIPMTVHISKLRLKELSGLEEAVTFPALSSTYIHQMHIEAAKMLSFTEEEFVKALDWGTS